MHRTPQASPVISIIVLFQTATQFDDAIAGGLWPPMVQAALDMCVTASRTGTGVVCVVLHIPLSGSAGHQMARRLNPFLRLSIHSLNVECVFGITFVPRSYLGKVLTGGFFVAMASKGQSAEIEDAQVARGASYADSSVEPAFC